MGTGKIDCSYAVVREVAGITGMNPQRTFDGERINKLGDKEDKGTKRDKLPHRGEPPFGSLK